MKSNHIARMKIVLCLAICFMGLSARADDTDLFDVKVTGGAPKVMLLVDTSRSMLREIDGTNPGAFTGCTASSNRKICILKTELKKFLQLTSGYESLYWPDTLEVGLTQYAQPGGLILAPVLPLGDGSAGTQRRKLLSLIDALNPGYYVSSNGDVDVGANTPLMGAYLEVAEYMTSGRPVSSRSPTLSDSTVWQANVSPFQYKGPLLTAQCGAPNNHIVYLTDGASKCEDNDDVRSSCNGVAKVATTAVPYTLGQRINAFAGGSVGAYASGCESTIETNLIFNDVGSPWGCVELIASALAQKIPSTQVTEKIATHVIGYGKDGASILSDLQSWAAAGDGTFANAQSGADLSNALKAAFDAALLGGAYTVAAGGVGVNQLNSFTYLDEIYFSTVTPSSQPFWYGNLKKYYYKFESNGEIGIYSNSAKTTLAVQNGEFLPNVMSEWSVVEPANYGTNSLITEDGNIAHIGGASSKMDAPANRKLVTYFKGTNTAAKRSIVPPITVNGVAPVDSLKAAMAADTGAPGTVAYSAKLDSILQWLMGQDELGEWSILSGEASDNRATLSGVRNFWGAPIHSSPRIVNYKTSNNNVENVLFVSSNDGKLYAIDSDSGEEKLAFMPSALLERDVNGAPSKIEQMYDAIDSGVNGPVIYGLDASWTAWREDRDGDGDITSGGSSTDFVYLYGGMRRGGRNYYVLDATEVNDASPDIDQIAVIEGGQTGTPFENNGQTWSEPKLAIVKVPNTTGTKAAAVFVVGGGYDAGYDAGRPVNSPAAGAQLHVVAAYPFSACGRSYGIGDVVWWASSASSTDARHVQISDMTYSIPSTVKTLDIDGNGYLDHIYVGDMGGQIMRFDLDATPSCSGTEVDLIENANSSAQNVLVAQLGVAGHVVGSTDYGPDRRFFYPPSVAIMRGNTGKFVGIALGSGWRSNPLDESVNEKMYFLKDFQPFSNTLQSVISEGGVTQSQNSVIQPVSVVATQNSVVTLSSTLLADSEIKGFSVELTRTAEKLLGSPLIIDNQVYFSTYYRDSSASTSTCTPSTGFSALYAYEPGNNAAVVLGSGLSQNAAGSVQAIIGDGFKFPSPPPNGAPNPKVPKGGILTGTKSPGSIPFDVEGIRKTRWYQDN